jgi:hypothetical protein
VNGEVTKEVEDNAETDDSETTSTGTSKNDVLNNEEGFNQSQADLLLKYRQTFINIDVLIIDELSDLFMQIY